MSDNELKQYIIEPDDPKSLDHALAHEEPAVRVTARMHQAGVVETVMKWLQTEHARDEPTGVLHAVAYLAAVAMGTVAGNLISDLSHEEWLELAAAVVVGAKATAHDIRETLAGRDSMPPPTASPIQ